MKTKTLQINGMTCGHCITSVKNELSKIEGVTVTNVLIGTASVDIDDNIDSEDRLRKAVEEAGYSVTSIQ